MAEIEPKINGEFSWQQFNVGFNIGNEGGTGIDLALLVATHFDWVERLPLGSHARDKISTVAQGHYGATINSLEYVA